MLPGLCAALIGVVLMHLLNAPNGRPMVYAVRVLEVTTLAGFLDQFILKMPGWGLTNTPEHRLLLVLAVGVGAALLLPLYYWLRLQRFARMIPTPVFAGFNNAVGLTLLVSQTRLLWNSASTEGVWWIAVALLVLMASLLTQKAAKGWPPGVTGLLFGSVVAAGLFVGNVHGFANVAQGAPTWVVPVSVVSWSDLFGAQVRTMAIAGDVLIASATLAAVVFLNALVGEETISQIDDAQPRGRNDWLRTCAGQLAATLLGSPVLTPSASATRAAVRVGPLNWQALCWGALLTAAVYASGLLQLVPLAGIVGLLLFDGWTSFDRPSVRLASRWLTRREQPTPSEKEDLLTIVCVMTASVFLNMVAAVFVGVLSGLMLYAWRNGKRVVRVIDTGIGVRSNCVRSRADSRTLSNGAERIRYIELEGALFFGMVNGLQVLLREQIAAQRYIVVDWSHVISADSTVARAFAKYRTEARLGGARVVICGLDGANATVREVLEHPGALDDVFPDADRALEWAENEVIRHAGNADADEGTATVDALTLLHGLGEADRAAVQAAFQQRLYRVGETVFASGEAASELMVILQGSVNIVVRSATGRDMRLARIRRGATMGEMSFLDASPRSATAVAAEDLLVGVLSRERFEQLARQWPEAGRGVLANLALDLTSRLRHANRLAASQSR